MSDASGNDAASVRGPGRPPSRNRHLSVHVYETHIGDVHQDSGGRTSFSYLPEWRERPGAVPLSLSMPLIALQYSSKVTEAFLWGLLPENPAVLELLAREHKISPRNPLALLGILGEDCAGAVQFLRQDAELTSDGIEWLDDAEIARRLRLLREQSGSIGRKPGERGQFSLGGAQSKTALLREAMDDQVRWGVPSGRIPTTHILKPPMPNLQGQVENEHFCLLLSRALGFITARSSVLHFGDEKCIAVDRYDRRSSIVHGKTQWSRIHQEDLCQALSVRPEGKYQRDGGPSARDVLHLLRDNSNRPEEDTQRFMRALALNFVILGTDAHAKNFSLLIGPGFERPQIRLAPMYDINSYLPYAGARTEDIRMAMSIDGRYENQDIMPRHWERESRAGGISPEQTLTDLRDIIARAPDLSADIVRQCRETGLDHPVLPRLAELVAQRCVGLQHLYGAESVA